MFCKVKEMSKKYSCSVGAVIVSALSSNPYFNTIPIIGCMTEGQVDDSMAGLDITMSEEDVKTLILR
jgi:aryl-alcohol dehydrogenase-like predicted oxidoreductase